MNRKSVYSCETCSALFVCLKFFQEHRKTHVPEGQTIFPCAHCHTVHTSEYESNLHSYSHKNEPPHSCDLCQKTRGISEEEVLGSRRSIGTSTDFYVTNISLDKPMIADRGNNIINNNNNNNKNHSPDKSINSLQDRKPINIGINLSDADNMHINNHVVDDNDDDDDDDDDEEDDDEDDEEEDDDDDDEEDDDEEDDEDEDGEVDEEDEENEAVEAKQLKTELGGLCKTNVTNFIYVTNQTINHSTTPQKNYLKPARPSRSTGKGKGNRKARLTSDGDVRRKFSCHHCGKSFKTKSHLQRHILTHTGEKPYHCNRCDCRFNQSSSLRNHVIAIHTKEYPHTCNNCSKGFLMPAVLQKHLQTSECGKITNQVVEFNK